MNTKLPYFIIAIVVLIADQVTKAWATAKLQPIDTMEIIPNFFRFTYARNRGVAFSLFADAQFEMKWILAGISTAAAIGVLIYLWRSGVHEKRLNYALSFLLAGIVGNLIDRVRLGEVVDFIDFHWYEKYTWPTFNIADAAICVGAVLLALEMMREQKVTQAQTTES
ncbi:MAG TPA: signal peptidase II [Blastocatellia bacterium]|nr:signal peptidase II [Blastocatellia bacterium]